MRPRTLLILLLLVVGLGAFVYFYERDLPGTEERTERADRLLPSLDADTVTAVTVERGDERLVLKRVTADGGEEAAEGEEAGSEAQGASEEWRLVEPLAARADAAAVGSFLDDLVGLEAQRTVEEPDRDELGLTTPRATVKLTTRSGEETVVEVGAELPVSDSMVVAVAGRRVAQVVPSTLWSTLAREAGDWRDKHLFLGERADIEQIRLAPAGGEAVVLARRDDAFWIESPMVDWADREPVDRLLSALVGLTAERFVDPPAAAGTDLGLEPPATGTLEVTLSGDEPWVLEVGAPTGEGENAGFYARVGDQPVEIDDALAEYLSTPPPAWRSLALTRLEAWEVEEARVADSEGEVNLRRDGTQWLRDGEPIAYTPVSDLLAALTGLTATSAVEAGAPEPAATPLLTVSLTGTDGEPQSFVLDPPTAGQVAARVTGRDVTLLLPANDAADAEARLEAVRSAEVQAPEGADEAADAEGIEVTAEEGDG